MLSWTLMRDHSVESAHRKVVHVDFGGQSPTTHTKKRGIKKEMKGWRERELYTLFFF